MLLTFLRLTATICHHSFMLPSSYSYSSHQYTACNVTDILTLNCKYLSYSCCYVYTLSLSAGIYDVSSFVAQHPGGMDQILMGVGRDITQVFDSYHQHDTAAK